MWLAEIARPVGRSLKQSLPLSVPWEKVAGILAAGSVVYLVIIPLATLIFSSVRDTKEKLPFEDTAFTLDNYTRVFSSEATYRLFGDTLWYAFGSLALGLVLATLFAWFLERGNLPARSLLILLVLVPLATPPITDAIGWALLGSPSIGLLNVVLRSWLGITGDGPLNIYSIPGMILVTGLKMVPSIYIMLSGPIGRFDPSLEEASFANKVSPASTFRYITFPLMRPAMFSALIYFLMLALEMFDIPAVLGMPFGIFVFSTLIYKASHPPLGLPNYGHVSVYATIFLLVAVLLIYLYGRAVRHKEEYSVITGKGYRAKLFDFGHWKWAFVGLIILYFVLAAVLPFAILVWTSLGLAYQKLELASLAVANLDAYRRFLEVPDMGRAIANTVIIAITSATATMVIAMLVSWLSTRTKSWVGTIPDRLAFLVLGVPGIVIGLALVFVYIWVPLPVYGTIWIIVIGLSTRYLAYSTRLMEAAYLQVHKELEEASLVHGASWLTTIRRIVLPLVWPSFARGWLWVLVHGIRDTAMAVMLFAVVNDTIGVRLWVTWFIDGNTRQASTIAVIMAVASIVVSFMVVRMTMGQSDMYADAHKVPSKES